MPYACSGFLVDPDLMATAGHCMLNTGVSIDEPGLYGEAYSWLFDYHKDINIHAVDKQNLYHCKRIIFAIHEDVFPFRDFALIELDRAVVDCPVLSMAQEMPLVGDSLFKIGHPFGAPFALSQNAKVFLNNLRRESFITCLDDFSGNSGSAVFNKKEEVVEILIAGTPSPETV